MNHTQLLQLLRAFSSSNDPSQVLQFVEQLLDKDSIGEFETSIAHFDSSLSLELDSTNAIPLEKEKDSSQFDGVAPIEDKTILVSDISDNPETEVLPLEKEALLQSTVDSKKTAEVEFDTLHSFYPPESKVPAQKSVATIDSTLNPVGTMDGLEIQRGYKRLGVLGQGGMGMVWRIRDMNLHRPLAMKIIRGSQVLTDKERLNFIEEAQISAQLQHPGIIPVHELGTLPDGNLYFTMREIKGRTLRDVMKSVHLASKDGMWRPAVDGWNFRRLIAAFHSVCETMAYAHSKGVIHRDLKPSNIMIGDYGEVLVVDWGIAKVIPRKDGEHNENQVETNRSKLQIRETKGIIIGTPAYMSPEQVNGMDELIDERSDVYCLGAMLYRILSGINAYQGDSVEVILQAKRHREPPPLRGISIANDFLGEREENQPISKTGKEKNRPIPDELVEACEKSMLRKRGERYQSASELAAAIQSWLEGSQRREKALLVAEEARQKEKQMMALQEKAKQAWRLADQLLTERGMESADAWTLWEESRQMIERSEELGHEREQLLQGALIYDPEMSDIHRRLVELEYKDYLEELLRADRRRIDKSFRRLRGYLEMLSKEEQQQWESRRQVDLGSINLLRRRHGLFVGREELRQQLRECLQENRLINLVGTAGVGKTHLALEVASQWREVYRKETVFCDVTQASDTLGIIQSLGEVLGVSLGAQQPIQQLEKILQRKGEFLLILDNVEQVIQAAAPLIQGWLQQTSGLTILLTSRVQLGLKEEQLIRLQPMSILEGIELFIQRAQRQSDIQLSVTNRQVIGNIVQRLDCLPLAVELAASRVSMLSLSEVFRRLSDSFDLLRSRLRDSDQRALQGALDWSWNLLSDWGKSALAQCSVFRNGFDLAAAERIIDLSYWDKSPSVLDVIEALCDDNLLLKNRQEDGSFRYGMLASIHAYAGERYTGIEPQDRTIRSDAIYRHAKYYSQLFNQSDQVEDGSIPQLKKEHIVELDNFIIATEKGLPEDASDCCLASMKIFKMKGPMSLGIELTSSFLSRMDLSDEQRLPIQLERVTCLRISGRVKEAREETKIALQLVEKVDNELENESKENISIVPSDNNSSQEEENLNSGTILAADGLLEQGAIEVAGSNWKEALDVYQQALDIYQQQQHRSGEAKVLGKLGLILAKHGENETALQYFQRAVMIAQELHDGLLQGQILGNIAQLFNTMGKLMLAQRNWRDAIVLCDRYSPVKAGVFRGALALSLAQQECGEDVHLLLDMAKKQLQKHPIHFVDLLCKQGQIQLLAGERLKARQSVERAKALVHQFQLHQEHEILLGMTELQDLLDGTH